MDSPSIFVAKRRFALAEERLDELQARIEARNGGANPHIEQDEINAAIDEYHIATVEAGLISREELVSNLRLDGLRIPKELLPTAVQS
jgi:hypothetical protein